MSRAWNVLQSALLKLTESIFSRHITTHLSRLTPRTHAQVKPVCILMQAESCVGGRVLDSLGPLPVKQLTAD